MPHMEEMRTVSKKQLYLVGGVAGLVLVILTTLISYYRIKFKQTENELAAAQANLTTSRKESKELKRELKKTQNDLEAKKYRIKIIEGTIAEVQQDVTKLSKAKADVEAEKQKLLNEKKQREEEYQDLVDSLHKEIENKEIMITELRGKLTVNLMDKILFDSGEARIKNKGKQVLDKIAETFLNRHPDREIRVEGHTDNRAFRGSLLGNWDLSAARAISAVRYLQKHAGVDATRLAAVGYAHHHPIDTNDTSEGRARNRRIEIIVMPPTAESTPQ